MAVHEVAVFERTGRNAVLAGALKGEAHHGQLAGVVEGVRSSDVVVFDASGVEVMTASYFNKCLMPFWEPGRNAGWFPVLRGLGPNVKADVELVLNAHSRPAWLIDGDFVGARVLGPTDDVQDMIIELVGSAGVTAADLYERDRSVRSTAWSNRLALLHEHSLLARRKDGRQLRYFLPWRGVNHG